MYFFHGRADLIFDGWADHPPVGSTMLFPDSSQRKVLMLSAPFVRRFGASILTAAVVGMLAMPAAPADAQQFQNDLMTGMQTGFGYAGAFPDLLLGVGAFHIFRPGGFGVMVDFKMNHESITGDPTFDDRFTSSQAGDFLEVGEYERTRVLEEWMIVNFGLVRPLTEELGLFAGVGAAYREVYDEYSSFPDLDSPASDIVVVENDTDTGWTTNPFGGAFLRLGQNVLVRMGYEVEPQQLGVGVYWVLSPR
jgi:hypothetical protein